MKNKKIGIIGGVGPQRRKRYTALLENILNHGAEGIILGCTELPLVRDYKRFGKMVVSSSSVLAEELVDYYYL